MTSDKGAPSASLSVIDGVSMMVGIVIGIGIFKTPALVASQVSSDAAFMGLWLLGGLITLVGALVYAELGACYPSTGGEYHFLSRAFGRPLGLLFAWARMSVIQTGAIAAVAYVFGDYARVLLPLGPHSQAIYAALAVAGFTAINLSGASPSTRAQHVFTIATVVTIAAVVVVGLAVGAGAAPKPAAAPPAGGAIGLAMIFILLTYGGWNEAAYLSAELRDVRRNMVRMLVLSTAAIVLVYLAINFAFLRVIGLEGMRGSQAVGADLMRAAAGDSGAMLLSVVVCCAALSTLNATIFTGARVYHAVGQDLPALRRLGLWNPEQQVPTNGLLIQGAIALALVGFGAVTRDGFQSMVDYTAPVFWFFLLLVGISLFVLRSRQPGAERPFAAPLYPVTPAIFCVTCAYLLYSSLAYTGYGALVGIAVLAAGIPLVWLATRGPQRAVAAE